MVDLESESSDEELASDSDDEPSILASSFNPQGKASTTSTDYVFMPIFRHALFAKY